MKRFIKEVIWYFKEASCCSSFSVKFSENHSTYRQPRSCFEGLILQRDYHVTNCFCAIVAAMFNIVCVFVKMKEELLEALTNLDPESIDTAGVITEALSAVTSNVEEVSTALQVNILVTPFCSKLTEYG